LEADMSFFRRRAWSRVAVVSSAAVSIAALAVGVALAQSSAIDEIAKYRAALQDGNPAELWEARGEGLWREPRGPSRVSLEKCDLGLGPGVVKGAYAQLPRYFADADRVMDLEARIVWCMVKLQGFTEADAKKNPFGGPDNKAVMEALVAYVTSESRGVKMNVAGSHPKEREAYRLGEKMFYFRGGSHDFSCATCHGEDAKRIRLQDLPNLTKKEGAQKGYTTWPAYRVSQGELRTFQWRLYDCFRQQRFPELDFASDASIALTMFLAVNANGAAFDAPAIKR
jgi:L-cysteine S-thiosulfotransferase